LNKEDVAHLDALRIIFKKCRRRMELKEGTSKKPGPQKKPKQEEGLPEAPKETGGTNKEKGQHNAGLGSLLCGYGSSNDNSE
jgi:hypothetical protein